MFRRALLVAVPLAVTALLTGCGKEQVVEQRPRPVMVVHPQPALAQLETYPGEVRARFEPDLAFRIGGEVTKRLVDTGDQVKKGQVLAELDPKDVQLQLSAMKAQVAAAEANLSLVRSERERYQQLLARQLVSKSQYENVENLYQSGEARLKQVKAEYNVSANQAGYAVLRAPRDGVVSKRMLEVGQVVAPGQMVFSLAADGEREIVISLPEGNISKFSVGQPVRIELWSRSGTFLAGKLREISPAADPQSRTYAARVAIVEDTNAPVDLGQSAQVFVSQAGDIPLSVPLSALTADAGQSYVWIVDPLTSSLKRIAVEAGPYGEESVPILDGLKSTDWIVSAGVQVLIEGVKVRPVDRDNRPVTLTGKE
ncbi:MAG TPA: efflux RND transporter periplasmic adaptor subunit [Pseudomonas sp.]|nr:efflux RND transporter periplasmic adaptor subunit [Pseudomonas sp.]